MILEDRTESKCRKDKDHDLRYGTEPPAEFRRVFFCVEVLRPSQSNGVMSSAVSLPNHTFTGHA